MLDRRIYLKRERPILASFLFSKCLHTASLFLLAYILKSTPIAICLLLMRVGIAAVLLILQKPFSHGKQLTSSLWFRVARYSLFSTFGDFLWIGGLFSCGPIRTVLLYDHYAPIVLGIITTVVQCGGVSSSRNKGSWYFIGGVLVMLLFDKDTRIGLPHPEGPHNSFLLHWFYQGLSFLGLSDDHTVGIVLLVSALLFTSALDRISKQLSADIGGVKRLYALSSLLSLPVLVPISIAQVAYYGLPSVSFSLMVAVVCAHVAHFYGKSLVQSVVETSRYVRFGTGIGFATASGIAAGTIFSGQWDVSQHGITVGLVISSILIGCGAFLLSEPSSRHIENSGMLPLYATQTRTHTWVSIFKRSLGQVLSSRESRRILFYLLLNLAFTAVEFVYGYWSNSLSLISDGFHMLFDSSALLIGLWASVVARMNASRLHPFGLSRVETVSGFINGVFLVVIACMLFLEAIGRLLDPPEVLTNRLLIVSVLGLLVNLIGVFSLHSHHGGHHHHGHSHSTCAQSSASTSTHPQQNEGDHHTSCEHVHAHSETSTHSHPEEAHHPEHSHTTPCEHVHTHTQLHATPSTHEHHHHHGHHEEDHSENLHGVFLHVLADTMGSVGVIISSLLIGYFGWHWSDPLCSVFISLLILLSVKPLLVDSFHVLSLTTPRNVNLQYAIAQVMQIQGVTSISNARVWQHNSRQFYAVIHLQVATETDENETVHRVGSILKEHKISLVAVQIEKQGFRSLTFISSSPSPAYLTSSRMYVDHGPNVGTMLV